MKNDNMNSHKSLGWISSPTFPLHVHVLDFTPFYLPRPSSTDRPRRQAPRVDQWLNTSYVFTSLGPGQARQGVCGTGWAIIFQCY
jgi:hypothetical protein